GHRLPAPRRLLPRRAQADRRPARAVGGDEAPDPGRRRQGVLRPEVAAARSHTRSLRERARGAAARNSCNEGALQVHAVRAKTEFKKMRDLVPEVYRAFLEFDQKAFKDGAIPAKTKELIALGIAHITQCPWCIDAHTRKAATAGASDAEIAETTF